MTADLSRHPQPLLQFVDALDKVQRSYWHHQHITTIKKTHFDGYLPRPPSPISRATKLGLLSINIDTLERRRLFGTLHVAYSYMSASQSEWPSPPPTVFGIVIPKLVALSGLMNNTASAMFFTSWFAASLSCCLYIKLAFAVGYLLHYNLHYVKRGPVNSLLWLVLPFRVWSPDTLSCKHRPHYDLQYIRTIHLTILTILSPNFFFLPNSPK